MAYLDFIRGVVIFFVIFMRDRFKFCPLTCSSLIYVEGYRKLKNIDIRYKIMKCWLTCLLNV